MRNQRAGKTKSRRVRIRRGEVKDKTTKKTVRDESKGRTETREKDDKWKGDEE